MKLSTLLLSSAALVVAGSAYAADLPAKKGAPAAKAMAGCPAFGAGFWQIPGGDTCLKIGGYVRSNNTATLPTPARGTATHSFAADYEIALTAMSNTDAGALKSFIAIDGGPTDSYAYIQVGGITAGRFADMTDMGIGGINGGYSGLTANGFQYDMPAGASTVSVGIVKPATNNGNATVYGGRPDVQVKVATQAGPAKLSVAAVSHEALGSTSGSGNGWALIGTASIAAGAASFDAYGSYGQGAMSYVTSSTAAATVTDASATSGALSTGSMVGGRVTFAGAKVFANQVNIAGQASGDTYKATNVGINYAITAAKQLTVTPEFFSTTSNTDGAGDTNSQTLYLRIQRDF